MRGRKMRTKDPPRKRPDIIGTAQWIDWKRERERGRTVSSPVDFVATRREDSLGRR